MPNCLKCGRPLAEHELLSEEEFQAVTRALIIRLRDRMSNAGCNDIFDDEFPESVVRRFQTDFALLEAWETYVSQLTRLDLP